MAEEERSIHKNKLILTIFVFTLVCGAFSYVLLTSTLNSEFYFRRMINLNTGEPLSILASIFLYILFGWFVGLVPSSAAVVFSLLAYCFLHRKDPRFFEKGYDPIYSQEYHYAAQLAIIVTYVATTLLLILHIFNVITIHLF